MRRNTSILGLAAGAAVLVAGLVAAPAAGAFRAPLAATASPAIQVPAKPGADLTRLPLGDARVSTTGAKVGWEWACDPGNPNAPGSSQDGPWITGGTWNLLEKLAVRGEVSWKTAAKFSEQAKPGKRVITTMRVPTTGTTGTFPIAQDDPAYEYDHNPGKVNPSEQTVTLPRNPVKAAAPSCLPMGAIGVAKNGVMLYNALDARNHDARAHEMQDSCEGHPNPVEYHYHAGSACVLGANAEAKPNTAVLFGYAYDGFGIYVERDKDGNMLTNADLDACHGRTSKVKWNGKVRSMYHYVVTQEFPYLLGCFAGTNSVPSTPSGPPGGGGPGGPGGGGPPAGG